MQTLWPNFPKLAHPVAKLAAIINDEGCTYRPPETFEQKRQRHFLHSSPQRPQWRRNSSASPSQCPPWLGPGTCPVAPLVRRNHSGYCHWALERWRHNSPEVSAQKQIVEKLMHDHRNYFLKMSLFTVSVTVKITEVLYRNPGPGPAQARKLCLLTGRNLEQDSWSCIITVASLLHWFYWCALWRLVT